MHSEQLDYSNPMACKACAGARDAAKRAGIRMGCWAVQLMPLFIIAHYIQEALYSALHWRLEAEQMAAIIDSHELVGGLYTVLDALAVCLGSALLASPRKEPIGVSLLLLHHTLKCAIFTHWHIDQALDDFVLVGASLSLLALRLSEQQLEDCWSQQQPNLQHLLLMARFTLCILYVDWCRKANNIIRLRFSLICCVLMLLGFRTKLVACLTALAMLRHAFGSAHWGFIFGWHDWTVSLPMVTALLSKVAGFLLLARLGAGKWSLDALWTSSIRPKTTPTFDTSCRCRCRCLGST